MFILRIVFWVAVVALLLPTAPGVSPSGGDTAQAAVGTNEDVTFDAGAAVNMAVSTGSDVLSFCERNEAVCNMVTTAGGHVVNQLIYYTGEAMSWATQALMDARQPEISTPPPSQGV